MPFSNGSDLNTPRDFVQSGWDYTRSMGQIWVNYTRDYLNDFEDIAIAPMSFETPVDLQIDYSTFVRPLAPTAPDDAIVEVAMPAVPVLDQVAVPTISAEPEEPDFSGLVYVRPTAPNRPLPEVPADITPVLTPVEVPDAPAITMPADPVLYALNLPTDFDLEVPEFTATAPVRNFDVPPMSFAWQWQDYNSDLVDTIKARLSDMVVNGLGLSPEEEAALFDRMRGREDVLSLQAMGEASDAIAAKGLRQPAGLLSRALERVGIQNRQNSRTGNRDLSIRMADMRIENIRFALSTAISLEVSLIQANVSRNELALRGAQAVQEIAVTLFNAKVALHNAEVAAFKVEADVFGERIRALQAEADVLRTQVEAQKAIGELNESLVRAYGEKMRALGILVDIHRSQVEAARAKAELNTQTLEQGRLRLQAYDIQVGAWAKEQDAYRISVDAELGNVRAQEVLGNVFSTRVQAWRTKNAAYFDQGRFQIESQAQELERYRAELVGAQIDSQIQLSAIDARLRRFATQGSVYQAEAQVVAAESAAHDRTAQMRLGVAQLRVTTMQRNNELAGNYALKTIDAQIETLKAKAGIVGQLAASSQSGVNFGASYSGSLGVGFSYGKNFSYSGDTDDQNPGF